MYAYTHTDDCRVRSANSSISLVSSKNVLIILQLVLISLSLPVSGQMVFHSRPSVFYFPDSSETRAAYSDVISAPLREVVQRETVVRRQATNVHRVEYRVIAEPDAVYQLFVPEQNGEYPVSAAGSYIIKRDRHSGRFEQLKVFLAADPGFFVRVFPDSEISRMDVFIAGERLHASVRLPLSFDRVLAEPFDMIARLTRHIVDWSLLTYDRDPDADGRINRIIDDFSSQQGLPGSYTRQHAITDAVAVERITSMLFRVYQDNPGTVVSGRIHPAEYPDSPAQTERIYLFPYVDVEGTFRVAGFIGSRRVALQSLKAQYQDSFFFGDMHLPDACADSHRDSTTPLN